MRGIIGHSQPQTYKRQRGPLGPATKSHTNSRPTPGFTHTITPEFVANGLQKSRTFGKLADTKWEPREVYDQLKKVRGIADQAGIPVLTVSAGHIRRDAVDATRRFVTMPLHVRNPDGSKGMARRQCTGEYKIKPLKAAARALLGYPHPTRIPSGIYAEQAIGISTDEIHRAKDSDVRYLRNVFPLLDLGMSRQDCLTYLADRGFGETVKSACVGCPFSGNARLRWIRDTDPDAWADLVAFDREIRHGSPRALAEGKPLRGQFFVHRSLQPLDQVDLGPPAPSRRHLRLVDSNASAEEDDPDGCSPWSCRSGAAVTDTTGGTNGGERAA